MNGSCSGDLGPTRYRLYCICGLHAEASKIDTNAGGSRASGDLERSGWSGVRSDLDWVGFKHVDDV